MPSGGRLTSRSLPASMPRPRALIDRALASTPIPRLPGWPADGRSAFSPNRPLAIEAFQRAIRLSPLDPLGYLFH